MPDDGKPMYCFLTGSDGSTVKTVTMDEVTDPATDRQLWSCTIPEGTYTAVQFSATDNQNAPQRQQDQKVQHGRNPQPCKNPASLLTTATRRPTRAAKVSTVTATGAKASVHDAESGKNVTVVDIDNSGTFTQQKDTKYITSTLYDYYTDYELNGLNRDSAPIVAVPNAGLSLLSSLTAPSAGLTRKTTMSNTRFTPGISNRQ